MVYIPMIIQRLACSDGNICGLLYRPHIDYDVKDIAGRYLIKFVAYIKNLYTLSWLAVIWGIFFLAIGSYFVCKILDIDSQIGKVMVDIYLLSFPLVCGAVFLLKEKKTLYRMLFSAFLLFVSMTFYQAYLFVAVVFMGIAVMNYLEGTPRIMMLPTTCLLYVGTQACDGMFVDNMHGYFAGWNKYIAAHFGIEYEMVWDKAQRIYDSDFYKERPLFPAEDSVKKNEDGIVVVKCKP